MKKYKCIMELIFIFIIPLILICGTSTIEKTYVYDNEGNFESSETELSFDNSIIKYTKVKEFKPTITSQEEIYNSGTNTYIYQILNFNNDNGTYYLNQLPIQITTKGQRLYNGNYLSFYNVTININYDSVNEEFTFSSNNTNVLQTIEYNIRLINENEFVIYRLSYDIERTGQLSPLPEEVYNKEIKVNKNLHKNVNTIWGNIKELLINNLDLNDSVLLDLIICYTILWFIMFILWHLLYLFFDMLIHIGIDWGHKEREKVS